ncbi:IST1 homolog [Danaus plexippus]|uniref:IST1 homolog n=1 Tax=Danaus plexippus plexippus TaxID=278856 RepID=A0A212EUG0_DANPL|nr:IST1 homolog [Danaus plexippus]XP_032511391.1 IST1 homolog [Danaus plexippus]OWR45130.1 IST1 protein [Danaus plexippus plexippus]
MFSTNPNYTKLKTHLRLAINRLKLLEKKKTELAQKARKEIAEYIAAGKSERAKIRVEHIIREDYMVEAMEIVEMYCDLILARFGLVTQMKELDDGLSEAISTLIWVAPRMHTDVQELKVISDLLTAKYGKIYADACRGENVNTISDKLKHKMSVQSPPKILVEKYLIEIAKNYNVEYTPDEQVMREEEGRDAMLIDINSPPNPPGFIGYPQQPPMPQMPSLPPPTVTPFNYPSVPSGGKVGGFIATPSYGEPSKTNYNIPPGVDSRSLNNSFLQEEMHNLPPAYDSIAHDMPAHVPTPQPRRVQPTNYFPELPELPSVPSDLILPSVPHSNNSNTTNQNNDSSAPDEIDFEDLNRRFEELKKKK